MPKKPTAARLPRPAEYDPLLPRLRALEKTLGLPRQLVTADQLDALRLAADAQAIIPLARRVLARLGHKPEQTPA